MCSCKAALGKESRAEPCEYQKTQDKDRLPREDDKPSLGHCLASIEREQVSSSVAEDFSAR